MNTSRSLQSLLKDALASSETEEPFIGVDHTLIYQAISNNFFQEAKELITKGYPSSVSLPELISDRLKTVIPVNRENDFSSLLVIAMMTGIENSICWSIYINPQSDKIHPENMKFVNLVVLFDKLQKDAKTRGGRYQSVNVLSQHVSNILQKHQKFVKATKPAKEFLCDKHRRNLDSFTKLLKEQCSRFITDPSSVNNFETILQDNMANIKDMETPINQHRLSLTIRNQCVALFQSISNAAKVVAGIIDDCDGDANEIELQLSIPRPWYELMFLLEAHNLAMKKRKLRTLDGLVTAMSTFEEKWTKSDDPNVTSEYITIMVYPMKRSQNIQNIQTATAKHLIAVNRALMHTKYVLNAAIVFTMEKLEAASMMNLVMHHNHDLTQDVALLNTLIKSQAQIVSTITAIYRSLKGLEFMNGNWSSVQFDGEFTSWNWGSFCHMEHVTPEVLQELRDKKIELMQNVTPAMEAITSWKKCGHCSNKALVICKNCKELVACEKCKEKNCFKCGNQM